MKAIIEGDKEGDIGGNLIVLIEGTVLVVVDAFNTWFNNSVKSFKPILKKNDYIYIFLNAYTFSLKC